ncbi:MAG: hypothetical protein J5J00_06570 [Deltaproteobacteria bacterium]|nr:hypothetical protein [Deltaproteobacteria bacterium]
MMFFSRSSIASSASSPEDSSVLATALTGRSASDTLIGSDTVIAPKTPKTTTPSQRSEEEKYNKIIRMLEESPESRFILSGGGGFLPFNRMAAKLQGVTLSDGGTVSVELKGSKAVVTVSGRPLKLGFAVQRDLLSIEKAITSPGAMLPVKAAIDKNVGRSELKEAIGGIKGIVARHGQDAIELHGQAALQHLSPQLNGALLPDGKILRVTADGKMHTDSFFRLGENGWSKEALQADFDKIRQNARAASELGIKLKVWLNAPELIASPYANEIRLALAKIRQGEYGDVVELRTNRQFADKLPGFVQYKRHVVSFERDVCPGSANEEQEIHKCRSFVNSSSYQPPLVVWLKRDTVGEGVAEYLRSLYRELGPNLKVLTTAKFKEAHPELASELNGERARPTEKESAGIWHRVWSLKNRFFNSGPVEAAG